MQNPDGTRAVATPPAPTPTRASEPARRAEPESGPKDRPRPVPEAPPPAAPALRPLRIALMDAGIGLLAAAAAVRRLRPDAELVLASDPDGMPWGPRGTDYLTDRVMAVAEAAAAQRPDALVVACNTATVHALPILRARFEPLLPVIGTVPAIKPAAAGGRPVAVWATPATTGSPYQRTLIETYAAGVRVTEVACPGLSDAVERADPAAIRDAIDAAAEHTPTDVRAVVLGCTHYELIAERVRTALGRPGRAPVVLHTTAAAVAAQTLRRIGARPYPKAPRPSPGGLHVLHSGRHAALPAAALAYAEGRLLLAAPEPAQGCAHAR